MFADVEVVIRELTSPSRFDFSILLLVPPATARTSYGVAVQPTTASRHSDYPHCGRQHASNVSEGRQEVKLRDGGAV